MKLQHLWLAFIINFKLQGISIKKSYQDEMADDWKSNVENSYKKWKYNDIHLEVKSYFKNIQHSDFGEPLKKESTSLSSNLSELKDEITTNKDDGKI